MTVGFLVLLKKHSIEEGRSQTFKMRRRKGGSEGADVGLKKKNIVFYSYLSQNCAIFAFYRHDFFAKNITSLHHLYRLHLNY